MSNDQLAFDSFKIAQRSLDELMEAAYAASDAVEREENAFLDTEKILRDHRNRAEIIEARITAEVSREKDGNDKAVFSNDIQRKAEVSLRLSNDSSYRDALRMQLESETEQRVRRFKIEKLLRSYSLNKLAFTALTLGRRDLT